MKKLSLEKIFKYLKWICTRAGTAYLVIFLAISFSVDINLIRKKAQIRSINRIMPLFDDLAGYIVNKKPLTDRQWQEYAAYYRKVQELIPDDPGSYFFLGYCLAHLKMERQAFENFEKAAAIAPGIFWFEYNLGLAYYNKGEYEKAEEFFRRSTAVNIVPLQFYMQNSTLYKQIIVSVLDLGFDLELSFNKSFSHAHIMLAQSLYQQKKYEQTLDTAVYYLKQGAGIARDHYYLIALSLKKLEKYQDMMSVLLVLLKEDYNHPGAWQLVLDFYKIINDGENIIAVEVKIEQLKQRGLKVNQLLEQQEYHLI